MRRSQNLEIVVFSVKKQLHKALGSVQFFASFTSFYFEILSYHGCGEKTIRLASKKSVKLDPKSASAFYSFRHAPGHPFPVVALHVNHNSGGFTVNQGFRLISLLVLGAED